MNLSYTYFESYRLLNISSGAVLGHGCAPEEGTTTTGAAGAFRVDPPIIAPNCTSTDREDLCYEYAGAFAPLRVTTAAAPPVGYVLSADVGSTRIDLAYVYELAAVTIAPPGSTVTTSVGAPTPLVATAVTANGSTSPLAPTFTWTLNGTGWQLVDGSQGATVTALAVLGAGVGALDVRASAVSDGTTLPSVVASVQLVAVPTVIVSAETNRTTLDAGGTVSVQVNAEGAAGFAYRAYFSPGLGLAPQALPCTTGAAVGGELAIACATEVRYPDAGAAEPTANVTNGYATGVWEFPELSVGAPPELSVTPTTPIGYAGASVDVDLSAANGSGARPFEGACLGVGDAPPSCATAPGPTWTFGPVLATPGVYPASAWARDAAGTNASVAFSIDVVAPLELGGLTTDPGNATVDAPLTVGASVGGGALPLRYWWNVSGDAGPASSGVAPSDGNLTATLVPPSVGPLEVTLTVVDRLGTLLERSYLVTVAPAPAVRVATFVGPPVGSVTAGEPVRLGWAAYDLAGTLDRTFATNLDLTLTADGGTPTAWVNASDVGPLVPLGPGAYGVPSSAWVNGLLEVNVTVATATTVSARLAGPGLPGTVAALTFVVAPDRTHVRLSAPRVHQGGGRTNETLWTVADRYGNPAPGAVLTVELVLTDRRSAQVVVAVPLAGGSSGVWINYSAPGSDAGQLTVVDAAGQTVLGPLAIPVPGAGAPDTVARDALLTAVPAGAIGLAVVAVVRRQRRGRRATSDEELRDLAEGRAHAVELVERAGEIDLSGLETAWEPPPAPPALADWLASLVADGTLTARVGEDGRPRFCLATGPPTGAKVTLDPAALDLSLRRRDDALGERSEDERAP